MIILEQLKCLRFENTLAHHPMITHTIDSHSIPCIKRNPHISTPSIYFFSENYLVNSRYLSSRCVGVVCTSQLVSYSVRQKNRSKLIWPLLRSLRLPGMRSPACCSRAPPVVSLVDVSGEGGQALSTLLLCTY